MKLTVILLIAACFQVSAKGGYAQNITLSQHNTSLEKVFRDIYRESGYQFFCQDELLKKARKFDIKVKDASIEQVLEACFKNQPLTYVITEKTITIKPKKEEQEPAVPSVQALIEVRGVVKDENGKPLAGVSVSVAGKKGGTTTDESGRFLVKVASNTSVLSFSYVGYKTVKVPLDGRTDIVVKLVPETSSLGDVIVVGYGTQKKETLTGSISTIKGKEILSSKTSNNLIENLQGKIPGLQIRQSNSQPGANSTSINIRGFGTPLFVIDGVLRDGANEFERIDPNDIESITVLKDGSAAIYGVGADNGVIIVTTKKGEKGKLRVSYSGNQAWSTPTNFPRMASAPEWVVLQNELKADVWDGTEFSKEETQKYIDGTAPGYESVNWYDETMKKYTSQQQHSLSLSGGSNSTSYFVSLGDTKDNGLLKTNAINNEKINFRSNLTFNLGKGLNMDLNLSGRRENNNQVPGGFWVVTKGTVAAAPFQSPYINNDPDFPAYIPSSTNPIVLTRPDLAGYNKFVTNFLQSSIGLTYDIPHITGLKIKGLVAYDNNYQTSKYLNRAISLYKTDLATGEPVLANTANSDNISGVSNYSDRVTLQAQLLYNTTIGLKNNLSGTLLYEQRKNTGNMLEALRNYDFYTVDVIDQAGLTNQSTDGSEFEDAHRSYVGRVNYDYSKKYLLEFAFRYDGSYRYNPDNRWGFFPVVSAGWRASEEDFFKNHIRFVNNLKFRGSYGITGEDAGNPFQYVSGYRTGATTGYEFSDGSWTGIVQSPTLVNKNLTWYKASTSDIGLDMDVLNNKLGFTFDLYRRDRTGLLAYRNGSLPNTFGATLPQENLNSDRVEGIEFSISHNNKIGAFTYGISANFNISRARDLYIEHSPYESSYSKWKNDQSYRNKNMVWGYQIIGTFNSWEQIRSYPVYMDAGAGNSKQLPGDPIYKDINGDGVITSADMLPMFTTSQSSNGGSVDYTSGQPPLQYGLGLNASWKGFDINILLQGAANYTIKLSSPWQTPFYAQLNAPEYFTDRWHLQDPFNKDSKWIPGTFPATRTINDASSVHVENSFWRRNASYLRVKILELGYTIPKKYLGRLNINSPRIYVNGSNLYTFCDKLLKQFDPERGEGEYSAEYGYPLYKTINVGLNITF